MIAFLEASKLYIRFFLTRLKVSPSHSAPLLYDNAHLDECVRVSLESREEFKSMHQMSRKKD